MPDASNCGLIEVPLIVVTVPKTTSLTAEAKPAPTLPDPALLPLTDWDREFFASMERMRHEMDQIFDDSFKEFRLTPEHRGFFDEPRFGSSVDLHEEDNNYVVRAYLPDRDMKDVNVTIEGQTLKIEAKAEEPEKKEKGTAITRKAHYSQLVTLPGPVQADKMKVDRKTGMLVVTLPKAESK